jgi:hypothetical protein
MLAIGCLIPVILAIVGGAVGFAIGSSAAGLWGGAAGFAVGLAALVAVVWAFEREKKF